MTISSKFLIASLTLSTVFNLNFGQNCAGCSDSSACFDFDGSGQFLGCYGSFSGGGPGLSSLCAGDFSTPNVSYAEFLGFTATMCTSVAENEIFFFNEGGVGEICNSELGTSSVQELWACSGSAADGATNFFSGTCIISGSGSSACLGITEYYCGGTDFVYANETVIDIGSSSDEYNQLSLLDGTYGGAICAREPTPAPTTIPTLYPSNPTLEPSMMPTLYPSNPTLEPSMIPTIIPTNMPLQPTNDPTIIPTNGPTGMPSNMPTEPTTVPTKVPTKAPTDSANCLSLLLGLAVSIMAMFVNF